MEKIGVPTDKRSHVFFAVLAVFASMLGWFVFTFYRASIVDAGCSEIAAKSATVFSKKRYDLDTSYDYDYLKAVCVSDSLKN